VGPLEQEIRRLIDVESVEAPGSRSTQELIIGLMQNLGGLNEAVVLLAAEIDKLKSP
jgi:hypothetical protein